MIEDGEGDPNSVSIAFHVGDDDSVVSSVIVKHGVNLPLRVELLDIDSSDRIEEQEGFSGGIRLRERELLNSLLSGARDSEVEG